LLTPVTALILLRTHTVQTYLAHRAADILSKELNTEVVIGGFRLNWFLEAIITDIKIVDHHKQVLLSADKIRADVKSIDLQKRKLHLKEISLTRADVNLLYYQSDSSLNLQFILDYFASPVVDTTYSEPWEIECNNVKLLDSHFAFRDERYASPGKGIDFSDMDFSGLNLEIRNILIINDSIFGDIKQLTVKEKSGLHLNDFTTKAMFCPRGLTADNLHITTEKSRVSMDLKFEYPDLAAFEYFLDSVNITARVEPSQLDMRDIVYFAPDIDGMAEVFDFSGRIRGTVSSFTAKDFQFKYGNFTEFKGNITMNGLPYIEETFVNLKTDEFYTNVSDIQSFTLPYTDSINTIALPEVLLKLGNLSVNGRFTGFYNDFVSKATFITDVGQVTTDILLTNNTETNNHEYNGKILVEGFEAGKMLNVPQLGTLNLYATIQGKNFSLGKADLTAKGEITDLIYEGNTFGLINIDGEFKRKRFTGGLYINDELVSINFLGSADFSSELPAFDFQADIEHANLAKLNLLTADSITLLSTSTDFKFQGNTLDNLIGMLRFSNTSFTQGLKTLKMKDLTVQTALQADGGKRMQVSSDFVDAVFSGQYTFDDMADYLRMVLTEYLPSITKGEILPGRLNRGSFDYTIQLHHTDSLTAMFLPWLKVNTNTVVSGTFNPALSQVNINGKSPMIVLNGLVLHNWSIIGSSLNKSLNVLMTCDEINMSEKIKKDTSIKEIEQFRFQAIAYDDSVKFGVSWDDFNTSDHYKGDITGAVSFKQNPRLAIRIDDAEIVINDTVWESLPENLVILEDSYLEARNFGFRNKDRHIILNGVVSDDPLSQLILDVKDFNISQTDVLTQEIGIDLDGYLNGKVNVSELFSIPHISADIYISKFGFNHESLGDAILKSYWDNENQLLDIDMRTVYVGNAGTHYPIKAVGSIYPEKEHNNFDLKIDVDNLKVRTIEPFLEGIFSRIRGYASGAITLTGDFSDPVLKGKVKLMRTEMLVDYLRTSYSFTGDFNFDKDRMFFKDIQLTDSTFGKGLVSGTISHKAFSDWALDIDLKADNLSVLNTVYSPVEAYYGKAKATGTMTLKGPIDFLVMRANVKSEKGTGVIIPITFSRSLSENDFIQYRRVISDGDDGDITTPEESSVLSLELGMDVTRNADIGIILPYQMGTIDVHGDGLINMGIDSRGEYSMFGNYVMDNGDFLFNFQNLLKKNFEIQKGGSITFNGSPYEADISLQAVYKVKTSLAGMPNIPEEYKSTRVNVDCMINLSGNLYNPDIKFSIAMPDATEDMKRRIFTSIDTSNALEMNQQMISLLVLNTFSSSSGISSSGASLGISSYELISAQLSRMLSQISKDFDIGVNYRPGDQLSPQELELALSTQLFDNRVTINGAVGMNTYNNASQTTQLIGDVLVEVKITEDGRFRVKAFNRTNTNLDVLFSGYSPYTQGVGVVYRREFNNLRDIFKRKPEDVQADSLTLPKLSVPLN
jgi:hypothetical protein